MILSRIKKWWDNLDTRYICDISPQTARRLDLLMKWVEVYSWGKVISYAIALLWELANAENDGGRIIVQDKDGKMYQYTILVPQLPTRQEAS